MNGLVVALKRKIPWIIRFWKNKILCERKCNRIKKLGMLF